MDINEIEDDLKAIAEMNADEENLKDQYMIDTMKFRIQQVVEKILQYFIYNIYEADDKPLDLETHDISELIYYVDEFDTSFSRNHQELMDMSYEIDSWDFLNYYSDDDSDEICSEYNIVKKAILIVKELYSEIIILTNQKNKDKNFSPLRNIFLQSASKSDEFIII